MRNNPTAFSLHADIDIDADGRAVSVRATGRQIQVEVPDLATGLELFRLGSPRGLSFRGSRAIVKCLAKMGLQLSLSVGGVSVATAGQGVRGVPLSPIGLSKCYIHPFKLLQAAFSRSSGSP